MLNSEILDVSEFHFVVVIEFGIDIEDVDGEVVSVAVVCVELPVVSVFWATKDSISVDGELSNEGGEGVQAAKVVLSSSSVLKDLVERSGLSERIDEKANHFVVDEWEPSFGGDADFLGGFDEGMGPVMADRLEEVVQVVPSFTEHPVPRGDNARIEYKMVGVCGAKDDFFIDGKSKEASMMDAVEEVTNGGN